MLKADMLCPCYFWCLWTCTIFFWSHVDGTYRDMSNYEIYDMQPGRVRMIWTLICMSAHQALQALHSLPRVSDFTICMPSGQAQI